MKPFTVLIHDAVTVKDTDYRIEFTFRRHEPPLEVVSKWPHRRPFKISHSTTCAVAANGKMISVGTSDCSVSDDYKHVKGCRQALEAACGQIVSRADLNALRAAILPQIGKRKRQRPSPKKQLHHVRAVLKDIYALADDGWWWEP